MREKETKLKLALDVFVSLLRYSPEIITSGIRLWADPPRHFRLRIDRDFEAHEKAELANVARFLAELDPKPAKPNRPSRLKQIHLLVVNLWGKPKRSVQIAVDPVVNRIDWVHTDHELLGAEYRDSGVIGVFVLTSPLLVWFAPLLLLVRSGYKAMENWRGMSRQAHSLLASLKGQLDPETERVLTEALRQEWKFQHTHDRQVTFEEAKDLLRTCKLVEIVFAGDYGHEKEKLGHEFHWIGEAPAEGVFYHHKHSISVFGSRFEGTEADELVKCFSEHEIIHEEDNE
ncbi:MAG TPA: hypothetical protein VFQ60_04345 [Patescibacteria group bacterium]|nr:hypothetical protein [Patescibacteria group bacterium]